MTVTDRDRCMLRAGDVVTVHITAYSEGPKAVPFKITLVEAIERFERSEDGSRAMPLIKWQAIDKEAIGVDENGLDCCDASYVTVIHSKGPYRCEWRPRNVFYGQKHEYFQHCGHYLTGTRQFVLWGSLWSLSVSMVTNDPYLDLPLGFSDRKLADKWHTDGNPGLIGYRYFKTGAENGMRRHRTPGEFGECSVLNLPRFKRWLIANIPHVKLTEAEMREQEIEWAKRQWEDYQSDTEYEYRDKGDDDVSEYTKYEPDYM